MVQKVINNGCPPKKMTRRARARLGLGLGLGLGSARARARARARATRACVLIVLFKYIYLHNPIISQAFVAPAPAPSPSPYGHVCGRSPFLVTFWTTKFIQSSQGTLQNHVKKLSIFRAPSPSHPVWSCLRETTIFGHFLDH